VRTIKFRAKAIVNDKHSNIKAGDFVFGCYIESGCDAPCIIFGDGEQIEVDKKTLGQLIGLDDCSGSAIYEGDVVAPLNKTACGDYIVAEIKYIGGAFVASTSKAKWNFNGINCMHHTIAGNIHDNPELMTQK